MFQISEHLIVVRLAKLLSKRKKNFVGEVLIGEIIAYHESRRRIQILKFIKADNALSINVNKKRNKKGRARSPLSLLWNTRTQGY